MNSDILFQIITKLDNDTLSKLALLGLWPDIKPLIGDSFWYARSQHLTGLELTPRSDASWKTIYHSIQAEREVRAEDCTPLLYNLSYLPSLLTLLEVYGLPDWNEDEIESVWSDISSLDVLTWLLSNGVLEPSTSGALSCLHSASQWGLVEMIEPLLALVSKWKDGDERADNDTEEAISAAASHNQLAVLQIFIDRGHADPADSEMMDTAIRNDSIDIVRFLISPDSDIAKLTEDAYEAGSPLTLDLLLSLSSDPRSLLSQATRDPITTGKSLHRSEMIQILLDRGVLRVEEMEWSKILNKAARKNNKGMIEMACSHLDPDWKDQGDDSDLNRLRRIIPILQYTCALTRVTSEPRALERFDCTDVDVDAVQRLVQRDDVHPENWSVEVMRAFIWALGEVVNDRIQVFWRAQRKAIQITAAPHTRAVPTPPIPLEHEPDSLYLILLRLVVIKCPSGEQLLSAISNHGMRETDERVMLLVKAIRNPSLTLTELIAEMQLANVDRDLIIAAAGLVGVAIAGRDSK